MAGKLDQTAAKLNTDDSAAPISAGGEMSPTTLRVLKILVVVMGIMIVAGVVTIVATIISRLNAKSDEAPTAPIATPVPATRPSAIEAFGSISHALPAGAQVVSVSADAGRLYVHYQRADGEAGVLVLNGATGAELGDVRLKATP